MAPDPINSKGFDGRVAPRPGTPARGFTDSSSEQQEPNADKIAVAIQKVLFLLF